MAYKGSATHIHRHVSKLLKGGLLKEAPVWYPTLSKIPAGPSIIRKQNASHVNTLSPAEEHLMQQRTQRTTIHHKAKHLRTKTPTPKPIVYPEDHLRRKFYKDHPFELHRPVSLIETDDAVNRTDFSALLLPGMHPSEVTGETVIRYQLFLMSQHNMPERKAYVKACNEFYEIRAKQEQEERAAREEATRLFGQAMNKPATARALKREEVALKGGSTKP